MPKGHINLLQTNTQMDLTRKNIEESLEQMINVYRDRYTTNRSFLYLEITIMVAFILLVILRKRERNKLRN